MDNHSLYVFHYLELHPEWIDKANPNRLRPGLAKCIRQVK
jgi:hypothetical protein